jgi:carbon-monoxide dehydrogenase large subunit
MDTAEAAHAGDPDYTQVGHPVLRAEDERHLHGTGRFVADIAWPGALHLAFVRSTVAHGVLRSVRAPVPENRSGRRPTCRMSPARSSPG